MRFRFGLPHLLGMLAAVLPMCLATSAMQSSVATMARSFKEAQSYMGFLIIVPMLPGVLGQLYPMTNQPSMYAVPMFGQYALMADVLGGRPPAPAMFVLAAGSALAVAVALIRLTTRLLHRETIIFSR